MNTFQFAGKTYKIVEDAVGNLVEGCNRCAFSGPNDLRCAEVDGITTGRVRCSDGIRSCHMTSNQLELK